MKYLKSILPLLLFFLAFSSSCKKDPVPTPSPKEFDKEGMLHNITMNSIVPGYEALLSDLKTGSLDLTKFRDHKALNTYVRARDSFEKAWKSWQRVSLFDFGPAQSLGTASVMGLFPIDTTQVKFNLDKRSFNLILEENQNARGFVAIDYLLNSHGSTQSMVNYYRYDSASALRIQYMEDCYALMIDNVETVVDRWSAEGGNYRNTFATGDDASIDDLVLAFAQNTAYLRTEKIALPAGLAGSAPDPFLQESFFGDLSLRLALAQIDGMRNAFLGSGSGKGLNDYLDHLNARRDQELLSKAIADAFDAAEARMYEIPEPFTTAISQSPNKIKAAHDALALLQEMLEKDVPAALAVGG